MSGITAVRVPKWGLSMTEGAVVAWHKAVGDSVTEDEDLVDIETAKITNVALSPGNGVLRRITVDLGDTMPVGALIGVIADAAVADAEIEAFIEDFNARFGVLKTEGTGEAVFQPATVDSRLGPISIGQRGDGSGDTILLIHGFASDMNSWGFNIEALGEGRTLVALDLPGHGTSTKNVGDGTIATLAAAVGDVLTRLEVERVHLVGHSLGAAVALQLAELLEGKLGEMVLVAPAGLPGSIVSSDFLNGLLTARRQRELKGYLEMLMADSSRVTHEMVEDIIKFRRVDGVMDALGKIRDQIDSGEQFAGLGALVEKYRPLVIIGEADRIIVRDSLQENGEVKVIPYAGHMPHVESPNEVNALIVARLG